MFFIIFIGRPLSPHVSCQSNPTAGTSSTSPATPYPTPAYSYVPPVDRANGRRIHIRENVIRRHLENFRTYIPESRQYVTYLDDPVNPWYSCFRGSSGLLDSYYYVIEIRRIPRRISCYTPYNCHPRSPFVDPRLYNANRCCVRCRTLQRELHNVRTQLRQHIIAAF
jgi:hypothetical protein